MIDFVDYAWELWSVVLGGWKGRMWASLISFWVWGSGVCDCLRFLLN